MARVPLWVPLSRVGDFGGPAGWVGVGVPVALGVGRIEVLVLPAGVVLEGVLVVAGGTGVCDMVVVGRADCVVAPAGAVAAGAIARAAVAGLVAVGEVEAVVG